MYLEARKRTDLYLWLARPGSDFGCLCTIQNQGARTLEHKQLRNMIPSAVPVPYVSSEGCRDDASVCETLEQSQSLCCQLTGPKRDLTLQKGDDSHCRYNHDGRLD